MWAQVVSVAEEEKREARSYLQQAEVELDRSEHLAGKAAELQRQLAEGGQEGSLAPPSSPR